MTRSLHFPCRIALIEHFSPREYLPLLHTSCKRELILSLCFDFFETILKNKIDIQEVNYSNNRSMVLIIKSKYIACSGKYSCIIYKKTFYATQGTKQAKHTHLQLNERATNQTHWSTLFEAYKKGKITT